MRIFDSPPSVILFSHMEFSLRGWCSSLSPLSLSLFHCLPWFLFTVVLLQLMPQSKYLGGSFWTLTKVWRTIMWIRYEISDVADEHLQDPVTKWIAFTRASWIAKSISSSLKFSVAGWLSLHSDCLWNCLLEDELSLFIRADNSWTLNQLQIFNMTTLLLLRGWHHKANNFMTVNSGPFVLF